MQQKKKKEKAKKSTAVYVSNLPVDTTEEELEETFKKAGVILIDPLTTKSRIKLYKDSEGNNKGDALVIYLREESVELACQLLDDTRLRPEEDRNMRVEPASFQQKEVLKEEVQVDKKLKQKAFEKLNKMLDWDENEEVDTTIQKAVVLKHMFRKEELDVSACLSRPTQHCCST
jgi:HIV Tat-specific factor 1